MAHVCHILLYRFRSDVPVERRDEHLAFIASMQGRIPGMIDLRSGPNICPWNKDFSHGFVMTFEDQAALDAYAKCDLHRELIAKFGPFVERRAGFDFVC